MLNNAGELFKLGILHEAIIHSCIKEVRMYIHACTVYPELVSTWSYVYSQLLERKKGQSVEDVSQSIECLCHIMTTVGSRLDTDKAKVRVILKVVLNNNYSMPLSSPFSLQGPLCPIQNMWQLKTTCTINPLLPCFRNHMKFEVK